MLHVDFYKVDVTKRIRTQVPLRITGEAPAKHAGAIIVQTLNALEIECLPADMPRFIEVEVSSLKEINDRVLVKELRLSPAITVISLGDQPVVRAAPPRKEEAPKPVVAAVAEAVAAVEAEGERPKVEGKAPAPSEAKAEGKATPVAGESPAGEKKGGEKK